LAYVDAPLEFKTLNRSLKVIANRYDQLLVPCDNGVARFVPCRLTECGTCHHSRSSTRATCIGDHSPAPRAVDGRSDVARGSTNGPPNRGHPYVQESSRSHKQSAEHHTHAAHHHGEAAKHHEAGHHEKAAHHARTARGHAAHTARGHALHARHHSDEAAKFHMEDHGTNWLLRCAPSAFRLEVASAGGLFHCSSHSRKITAIDRAYSVRRREWLRPRAHWRLPF
jgi:hypothetical protein